MKREDTPSTWKSIEWVETATLLTKEALLKVAKKVFNGDPVKTKKVTRISEGEYNFGLRRRRTGGRKGGKE